MKSIRLLSYLAAIISSLWMILDLHAYFYIRVLCIQKLIVFSLINFMKRTNLICTLVFELCVQLEVRVDLPFSSRSSVPSRRDGVSEVLVKGVSLAGVGLVSCQTVKMDRFPN